jgi:hypothetical protein
MDLAQLFNHYGSDKDRNGYSSAYFTLFDRFRNDPISLLEIGIGTMYPWAHSSMASYALDGYRPGGSLRAWRDFFPFGDITGIDVQKDTQFTEERIQTYLCDSRDTIAFNEWYSTQNDKKYDIIIDDGSHQSQSQWDTLKNMFPLVKDGGIYVIEDIYIRSEVTTNPEKTKEIAQGYPLFFTGVNNNLCFIYKKPLNVNTSLF